MFVSLFSLAAQAQSAANLSTGLTGCRKKTGEILLKLDRSSSALDGSDPVYDFSLRTFKLGKGMAQGETHELFQGPTGRIKVAAREATLRREGFAPCLELQLEAGRESRSFLDGRGGSFQFRRSALAPGEKKGPTDQMDLFYRPPRAKAERLLAPRFLPFQDGTFSDSIQAFKVAGAFVFIVSWYEKIAVLGFAEADLL